MSTRYLEILSVGNPIDLGVDTNNRTKFSLNFETMCAADSDSLEAEMASLIQDASLGTLGTDMWYGQKAVLPTGDGPYMRVVATGGPHSLETHDGSEYERPTFQVTVTGTSYNTTRTRAYAIWRTLKGVRNTTVAA